MSNDNQRTFFDDLYYEVNVAPVANAGDPISALLGQPVFLDATTSIDVNQNISTYRWDLDNDGVFDFAGSSVGLSPSQVASFFPTPGQYTFDLEVTDDLGFSDSVESSITISSNAAVPEPTSLALLAMGTLGLIGYRRRSILSGERSKN